VVIGRYLEKKLFRDKEFRENYSDTRGVVRIQMNSLLSVFPKINKVQRL
jgi:hypothetical protein